MAQFHWDPDSYMDLMRAEVPLYDELQDAVAAACDREAPRRRPARVLELGTGTGETALRVTRTLGRTTWTGIDASTDMLDVAKQRMRDADLRVARLEDDLPAGPFDLAVSVLCVHHLDLAAKTDLFTRLREVVQHHGVLVLGDVIIPADPADVVTPLEPGVDLPDSLADLRTALSTAGWHDVSVPWVRGDLAVLTAAREPLP